MPKRTKDWLKQAERDFEHAQMDLKESYYEWACFTAQQAAEKALKALHQHLAQEAWGHSIKGLLESLQDTFAIDDLLESAKILDKYYIPTRYPNGFDIGAPTDYFTKKEAKEALEYASQIIRFCKNHIIE